MRSREEFDEYIETTLLPKLEVERGKARELAALRKAARLPARVRWPLALGGVALGWLLSSGLLILAGAALPWIIDGYRMWMVDGPEVMDVRHLIREVVEFWGPDFRYDASGGVGESDIDKSRLLPGYDSYGTSDMISGKYHSTSFRFSELRLYNRDDEGHSQQVWSGFLLIADFNKSFKGRLWVLPDASEKLLGSLVARAFQSLQLRKRGRLIHMENSAFERRFKVYGEDDQEARYILTPSLMRRILALREQNERNVSLAFVDDHVYVALESESDLFKVPSMERVTPGWIRRWAHELHYVTGLLDALDLNTRIWSKQH